MHEAVLSRNTLLGKVFTGLFLSLLTAFIGLYIGQYIPYGLIELLMIVEIVMIVVAMFMQRRRSMGMPFVMTFTFISGITLFPIIQYYTAQLGGMLVLEAAGVTAAAFLVAAIVASQTSMDFSFLGGFLFVGLIAIVLMGIVSIFTGFSTVMDLTYSLLGVAIFIGYILFDVNRIARYGVTTEMVPWVVLSLYLDILNLFLFILRLLGVLQSSRR